MDKFSLENPTPKPIDLNKSNQVPQDSNWRPGVDYPTWMVDRSLATLKGGYLMPGETPKGAMQRIARRVDELMPNSVYNGNLETAVFDALWRQDICPSSPVWSNFGLPRGLPISCFGSYIDDSISGIYSSLSENAKMSQLGGGTSSYWGDVRQRGSLIKDQTGSTGGPFEFLENYDGMITKVSQGSTRRGSHAAYMNFSHGDILEFLTFKRVGSPIQNLFSGVIISENDMENIYAGDPVATKTWSKVLESRNQTGMPYLLFQDNVNDGKTTPPWYGLKKTQIKASNLCN